jgi:hypothetical protein
MKTTLITGAYRGLGYAGIVWLAADASQDRTGIFWRDKQVIPW